MNTSRTLWIALVGLSLAGMPLALADIVATKTLVHTGQVTRATADGVSIQIPAGEITVPRSEIVAISVAQPAAVAAAANAVRAKNFADATKTLKPVIDQLAGLNVPWMEDAVLLLGDAYAGIPDASNAKKYYDLFRQLYPTSTKAALIDGKMLRIQVELKQYAQALPGLEKFLAPLLAKQSITDAEELAVAESLLLQGDCQRATGKLDAALDSYLTIATLFDVDPFMTIQARQRAAEVFEQQKKWKRAKQSYEELLAKGPPPAIAEDTKKKLAALHEAHPE